MSAPTDNCGNCLTRKCAITCLPYAVQPDADGGVQAWYRCTGCGHQWWTSWLLGAEEAAAVLRSAGAA